MNDTLIRHVRVFNGESMVNNTSVLITNGKVAAIGKGLRAPIRATVVEGKGCTLLPGLIDAHTHIRSRQDLEQSLALGVTTDISLLMDVNLFPQFRAKHKLAGYCVTDSGSPTVTLESAATRLHVNVSLIRRLIRWGILPAR